MSPAVDLPLAVLLHLQRWPYDPHNGQRLILNVDTLEHQAQLLLPTGPRIHWQNVLLELTQEQLVEARGSDFQLTVEGRRRGQAAHRRWMTQGFQSLIQRATCRAYDAFCRDAMNIAVGQLSPLDDLQLALLLSCVQGGFAENDALQAATPGRFLDLGCGTGGVTAWLAQHADAIAYGVDVAVASIGNAARRYGVGRAAATETTTSANAGLQFHRADITALHLPEASFQVLVAIDVVSFLDDPAEVIADWLRLLAPGGRLVILGSEHPDTQKPTDDEHSVGLLSNSPDGPRFLPHLSTATLDAYSMDLSAIERRIYRRQREVLPGLRGRFEVEGQAALYDLLWREAQRYGHWADTGQSRRWLTVLRPV